MRRFVLTKLLISCFCFAGIDLAQADVIEREAFEMRNDNLEIHDVPPGLCEDLYYNKTILCDQEHPLELSLDGPLWDPSSWLECLDDAREAYLECVESVEPWF